MARSKTAAPRQRLSVEARKEKLVEFGRRFFATHGYDELSVEELAAQAGVSKALVYHYYGSKHGLCVATIDDVARRLELSLAPPPGLPLEEALRASLRAFVLFVRDNSAIYRTLLRGGIGNDPAVSQILERVRQSATALILGLLGKSRPSPTLRIALAGWIGFAESATLAWLEHRGVDADGLVEVLVDALAAVLPSDAVALPHDAVALSHDAAPDAKQESPQPTRAVRKPRRQR